MSKVERLFSFTDWAKDHPSDSLPGDRVDIQFENHRAAIASLDQAVRALVRADGKLNHDLLTPESLPRELTTTLARCDVIISSGQCWRIGVCCSPSSRARRIASRRRRRQARCRAALISASSKALHAEIEQNQLDLAAGHASPR